MLLCSAQQHKKNRVSELVSLVILTTAECGSFSKLDPSICVTHKQHRQTKKNEKQKKQPIRFYYCTSNQLLTAQVCSYWRRCSFTASLSSRAPLIGSIIIGAAEDSSGGNINPSALRFEKSRQLQLQLHWPAGLAHGAELQPRLVLAKEATTI